MRLFDLLKNKLGLKVSKYKCDYEIGAMNAVRRVFFFFFFYCTIKGCVYHYNKAIWKKAKSLKLTSTSEGRKVTRLTTYLPLLPPDQILQGWMSILNIAPKTEVMGKFKEYFDRQWIVKISPQVLSCYQERTSNHRSIVALERDRLNTKINKKPNFCFCLCSS